MTNGNDLLRTGASQHRYDVYLSLFHANYSGYCDSKDHWLYSAIQDRHVQMFHFEDSPTRKAEQNGSYLNGWTFAPFG
jgi:hypothetical protein